MKFKMIIAFIAGIAFIIGGCEKESDQETTETTTLLDEISVSVNESAEVCAVCNKIKCICGVTQVPIMHPDEYKDLVANKRAPKNISIRCKATDYAPEIDGIANDTVWKDTPFIETLDHSSQRPIEIKCCHDGENIYFLVKFFDLTCSASHKTWIWNKEQEIYLPGNDREDCLVLKWKTGGGNMSFHPDKAEPHTADVWFWKARRTNPAGYFDDKYQIVSLSEGDDTFAFPSDTYSTLYLARKGDSGRSAYEEKIFYDNIGPAVYKYYPREPQGSRADIKAKGIWKNNFWTIEFTRKLNTGHADDIIISTDKECEFGICLYEMAATGIESSWTQPLYRTGDVFDIITLTLE